VPPPGTLSRPLASLEDYRACVQLQREIWGHAFGVVPAAILQVSGHVGGLSVGAFDANGQLVGFVFGVTGVEEGRVVHWSHMLGVRPGARNSGVGRLLKEFQRQELLRRDISAMHWTFDPLIAKNAHFNLNTLGARVVRYVPDVYGATESPLHRGLATDRLVVVWKTARPSLGGTLTLDAADLRTPVLTVVPRPGDPVPAIDGSLATRVRLEIPGDFARLLADKPADARAWHEATGAQFQRLLAQGYGVTGFRRDTSSARSFYLLELRSPALAPMI
jgi:chorismate synthase